MLSSNLVSVPTRAWSKCAVLYGGLCLVLFACMAKATGNIADLDLWHELALAREAFQLGHIPLHDSFAYTPTLRLVVHHEWGAGVAGLVILNLLGGHGLMLWNFLLAAGALCLALAVACRRGAGPVIVALCGLLAAPLLAGGYQPVRAQAYGLLFFCVALYTAERVRAGDRRWLVVWLALFPLWVNLHASCVLAFVIFGLLWLERRSWRVAAVLAGMAALLFVNPYGSAYVTFLLRAVPKARPLIDEWHPAWTSEMFTPVAIACAVFLYAVAARRPRTEWTTAVLVALLAMEAILHRKMIPFFAFAWLAYVPAWMEKTGVWRNVADLLGEYEKMLRLALVVALAGCAMYLLSTRPWDLRIPDRDARPSYPVGPVRFLKSTGFHGRLLAHFEQGAYIIWELTPAVRVAVDSRYEVAYPDSVVEAAVEVYQSGDWAPFTRQYPTDLILTRAQDGKLASALASGAWQPVYRDGEYTLWQSPVVPVGQTIGFRRLPSGSATSRLADAERRSSAPQGVWSVYGSM
jgi:hypothetical protein